MSYGVSYELWGMAQIQKKIKKKKKIMIKKISGHFKLQKLIRWLQLWLYVCSLRNLLNNPSQRNVF